MANDILADLDVFYGDLTAARAYVYARLPRPADDTGLTLTGQVRGPRCKLAQTLPVTSPLVDLGPGPTLLARALVPDPVFWTPDLPAIYDVTVNLLRGTEIIATERRQIGLRSLGIRGRSLFLNGKRWVLRGVWTSSTTAISPQEWHEVGAVYASDNLRSDRLTLASECGALTMARVAEPPGLMDPVLRSVARFPAVAIALIEERIQLPADFRKSSVAPNLIFAQKIDLFRPWSLQPWADLLVVNAEKPELIAEAMSVGEIPIIAYRRCRPPVELVTARAACDELQRDLAPLGQFAGYVV
jgi:hypothetical protein